MDVLLCLVVKVYKGLSVLIDFVYKPTVVSLTLCIVCSFISGLLIFSSLSLIVCLLHLGVISSFCSRAYENFRVSTLCYELSPLNGLHCVL